MAVLVCSGFERGTHLGLATGNANNKYMDRTQGTLGTNVEVVSAAARTGSYGLRLTASAATVFCGFANNAQGGVLGTAAVIVQSFWFRIPSLPGANAIVWSSFGTVGGADMALRFVQSTGTLNAEVGASTITGPTISANTWYHVDLKADYGVNPHTLDWRIDGIAQTQVTAALAAEQIFISGWGLDNAAQTITFHVDDTLMSTTAGDYPFGKHKVVQLIPDTGGSAAEIGTANATVRFTGNATADGSHNSADILTAISEVPPLIGASATGVCQVTSGSGNAVGIPMTSYTLQSGETVGGLRIVVTGWAQTTTAAAIGLRTFNGTTETTLFSSADPNFDASTTAPAGLCKMATLANFDTQGELDALVVRLGYSTDVSPIIGAHAIYAELAVKESTSTDATPTPSTIATTVTFPQATPSASSTVTPAVTSAVATVPQAVAAISVTQAPSPVAAVVGLPAATISADATVTPNVISASVSAPQAGATVAAGPAAVSAVVGLPQAIPVTAGNATATPAATTVVVGAPQATVSAASTVNPATTAAVVSLPAATALAGGNTTVQPAAITGTVTFPSATPSAGATATPAQVASTVALPAAIPAVSDTAQPAVIVSTAALPQATLVTAGNTVAQPAPIVTVVTVPAATPNAAAVVSPSSVVVLTGLPLASVGVSVFGQPATITTVVTVPQVTVFGTPPTFGTATGAVGAVPGGFAAAGASPSVAGGLMPVPTATGA